MTLRIFWWNFTLSIFFIQINKELFSAFYLFIYFCIWNCGQLKNSGFTDKKVRLCGLYSSKQLLMYMDKQHEAHSARIPSKQSITGSAVCPSECDFQRGATCFHVIGKQHFQQRECVCEQALHFFMTLRGSGQGRKRQAEFTPVHWICLLVPIYDLLAK